jgi:Zn-dependent M28 family amino/carboxypeptidase
MSKPAHKAAVLIAGASATALVCAGAAVAGPPADRGPDPAQFSKKFRAAVTPEAIGAHLDAFQAIADEHGDRASGNPGYDASRDYVVEKLRAAGYSPQVQSFTFPFFSENSPTVLEQVTPDPTSYTDYSVMSFSGSGDVTAAVVPVDTAATATDASTSGCEAEDFAGFPAGAIALMQRGSCAFGDKASNAEAAGAAAAVIFNRGTPGAEGDIGGTLGHVVGIPVVGSSFAIGQDLADPAGTTAHVVTDTTNETKTTYNVIAETAKGDPNNVVMAGAHLDSVDGGAGINDNGSGSAAILAVAEALAKEKKITNKVRFGWWGAEEAGLLGSQHWVYDQYDNNPGALEDISMYLNFDMIGSPNYVRFVYDGDNSMGGGVEGPDGSAQIEQLFTNYFASQGLASEETEFSGRSDYGPFLDVGIASGGLFTGAEGVKTAEQAATYGGTAGEWYDPCYHQACDDRSNISESAIDEMSDAVAHAVYTLSQSTALVNGEGKVRGPKAPAAPTVKSNSHASVS